MGRLFHRVRLMGKDGPGAYYWVRKSAVVGVPEVMIPSAIQGPGGVQMTESKAGLDMGTGLAAALVTTSTVEELLEVLDPTPNKDVKPLKPHKTK